MCKQTAWTDAMVMPVRPDHNDFLRRFGVHRDVNVLGPVVVVLMVITMCLYAQGHQRQRSQSKQRYCSFFNIVFIVAFSLLF